MHKSKLLAGLCLAALLTLPGLAKERREIPKGLTWDLEQIYASEDAWQAARQRVAARLPEMAPFQGHLAESLGPAFSKYLDIRKELERVNAYAYFLADHGGDLAEARRLVEGALKDLPESRSFLDTLGWVQFRERRLEEAEATLRKAQGDDPGAVVLDHLADVLAARGKAEEARRLWERAVERPWLKDSLRERIRAKLSPAPSPAG